MEKFEHVNQLNLTKKIAKIAIDEIKERGIDFNGLPIEKKQLLSSDAMYIIAKQLADTITSFLESVIPVKVK